MKFLKNIFSKKEETPKSPVKTINLAEFWTWFEKHESRFFNVVKSQKNIQIEFVNPVFNKLNHVQEGAFLLTGMMNENKAEIVFTAEGNLLKFPYIKAIVNSAPKLENWQFTAFKPSMEFPDFGINMGQKSFSADNIYFYPENNSDFPDEIAIKLVYKDAYKEDEQNLIENGTFIFLENYLGEVKTATQIDKLSIEHNPEEEIDLNPITKLHDYINWREKEFEEKYEGTVHNSDDSTYSSLEWSNEGKAVVGVVNSDLIKWDKKATHPWIMVITIKFDENENNGMPNQESLQNYYQFEDRLRELLPDKDGYVHVAQTTGLGKREIYYANKEYLKPIEIVDKLRSEVTFEYDIEVFKDKYWQSMKHFEH